MFFQTDPVLQLNGEHSISELSILLSSNGNTIACANIGSPKLFSDWKFKNGIQGSIELTHLFGSVFSNNYFYFFKKIKKFFLIKYNFDSGSSC